MSNRTAIVIGAGIVGLATARALAVRGVQVTVIERNQRAVGASIRNFGMIWPIGQPDGEMYEQASLSRRIWLDTCASAGIWHDPVGSLHLGYHTDEFDVLEELTGVYRHRNYQLLSAEQTLAMSPSVVATNLKGALFSQEEMIVDPRNVIARLPTWLHEQFGVRFLWGRTANAIEKTKVHVGAETLEADEIFVCSGADFETLFPEVFAQQALTRCKLQMLKMKRRQEGWRLGPALCAGLSLLHYGSFKAARSLEVLRRRVETDHPKHLNWGIHVMVSQNGDGDLIVGDSHEYALTFDPFNRSEINDLILDYLKRFAVFDDAMITETWNGIYPKLTDGRTNMVLSPIPGVTIINGLGGAGMTLGFGLCEQVIAKR